MTSSEEEQPRGLWVSGSLSAAEPAGRRRYALGYLEGFFIKHRTTGWDASGPKEAEQCRKSHTPPDWGSCREPTEKKGRWQSWNRCQHTKASQALKDERERLHPTSSFYRQVKLMTTSAVQQTSIVMPSDIDRTHHTDKSSHSVTGVLL